MTTKTPREMAAEIGRAQLTGDAALEAQLRETYELAISRARMTVRVPVMVVALDPRFNDMAIEVADV